MLKHKETDTLKWKRAFIRSFFKSMRTSLLRQVPNLPRHWDGHQLRELIADQFEWERTSKMRTDRPARRDYRREAANLP
jgi:hypothetical protein